MDKRHFERFYEEYFERIYRFVFYRVGGNREHVRDLTQDIFLKAFEAFDRYDPTQSHSAWIYTIARNHVINVYAKTRPGITLEEVEGSIHASHDPRHTYLLHQEEITLHVAIESLPLEDARLLRMKYLEGWSFDDLSVAFEKSSGALRVQAGRALKKMQSLLRSPRL